MDLPRRRFLALSGLAAALPALPRGAYALDYPSRPVRVFVGYTPGSAPDVVARLMAQWLQDRLGQPFVVENRPGAGTNLATEAVAHADPDGYTLLLVATPSMISGLLYDKLNFDFVRDLAPVGSIGGTPFVMLVNPSFPAKSVAEFVAYAKANPGKVIMASQGTGTLTHISGELFRMLSGVDMLHVPYHGEAPALTDLISGRVQVMFDPIITALGYLKDDRLRALGVTTAEPVPQLPGVPVIGDTVKGYAVEGWLGIAAPKGAPADIVAKLNGEIGAGLADAKIKKTLIDLGNVPTAMTPDQYRTLIADEIDKWGKVIKFAGVKLD